MSKFKIQKVRRTLRFVGTSTIGAMYNVWKVSGPRMTPKYFRFRYEAEAWVKSYTTRKPLTAGQLANIINK
ncbi:MAG: hypothetical protein EB120_13575 [Proteobacteria bacterium]|nr:hypothetical protein [Pseudomonadota bacterium]